MTPAEAAPRAPTPSAARPLLVGGAVVLVILLAAGGLTSYRDLTAARAHEAELQQRIQETEQSVDRLKRRIESLGKDPAALERAAREELGMVKPGEVLIVLPREAASPQAPVPAAPTPDPPAATPKPR